MRHARTAAAAAPTAHRGPSRLLIALATAWMVLSLAVGSAMTLDRSSTTGGTAPTTLTGTVDR